MLKHKFALIGTSCSGKTTLAYGLVARLKSYGVLADGVFNQDRKFSFDRALVETEESAQNWMITNIISKEIDIGLHEDIDILLSDRSVVDLYAYYHYQYPDSELCIALGHYVRAWAQTYDALYYLEPLDYQNDNKRPADDFRTAIDKHLVDAILPYFPNVVYIGREEILNHILSTAGIKKPGIKDSLTEEDLQTLSNTLGRYVVYKPKQLVPKDTIADIDLYIYSEDPLDSKYLKEVTVFISKLFGAGIKFDISLTNSCNTFSLKFKTVHPET